MKRDGAERLDKTGVEHSGGTCAAGAIGELGLGLVHSVLIAAFVLTGCNDLAFVNVGCPSSDEEGPRFSRQHNLSMEWRHELSLHLLKKATLKMRPEMTCQAPEPSYQSQKKEASATCQDPPTGHTI